MTRGQSRGVDEYEGNLSPRGVSRVGSRCPPGCLGLVLLVSEGDL